MAPCPGGTAVTAIDAHPSPARRRTGLRVGFCCGWDPRDPNAWSGYAWSMRRSLMERGCDVVDIAPVDPLPRSIDWVRKAAARAAGRFYHWDREPAHLERMAAVIDGRCREERPDILFAPSSVPLTRVGTGIAKAFATDQVFPSLLHGYVRPPVGRYASLGLEQEREALATASFASFPSTWAVDQAVATCGADAGRTFLMPWGANLASEPTDDEVGHFLETRRHRRPCSLVFIGRDWRRKGGDIVLSTVHELERRGAPCTLTVIGTQPPGSLPRGTQVIPRLDRTRPEQGRLFASVMGKAHFLFVPSRAEAYGQVFCEAAAYGLPVVSTRVGGIPSIVADGETGFLLPPGSGPGAFADTIVRALADPEDCARIGLAARARYRDTLNWRAFGACLAAALEAAA